MKDSNMRFFSNNHSNKALISITSWIIKMKKTEKRNIHREYKEDINAAN